jgi:hypothetical protein
MRSTAIPLDELSRFVTAHSGDVGPDGLSPARDAAVQVLPDWVGRHGLVASAGALWLWVAPAAVEGTVGMSQAVLAVPDGRYVVDTLDTSTGGWISREVTAAPPLVIGLPRRGGPVLLRLVRL